MSLITGNRRVVVIVTFFVILAMSVVLLSYYGNKALSGAKGYIIGERHWSMAQKQGLVSLIQLATNQDERYYDDFNHHLEVIIGDREARLTLSSENPDYRIAYEGFSRGNLKDDEIDSMIWLFRNFRNFPFMREAIEIWKEADGKIDKMMALASDMQYRIEEDQLDEAEMNRFLQELFLLDSELTVLERNFSDTIREASIQVESIILYSKVVIIMLLILTGGYITVKFFRDTEELNRQLSETESKFRNVLENSKDVIYQMDPKGIDYEYISPSVERMTGYSTKEIMDGGREFLFSKIHPDDIDKYDEEWEKFCKGELDDLTDQDSEFRMKTKWGHYIWVSNRRSMVRDENGDPVEVVGNVRNITDQKKYLEQLNRTIKEKEILMAEIHHRVKNNLSIVSGLIEVQKNDPSESIHKTLNELQTRIMSIAIVHEKLYNSETFTDVMMPGYLTDLTEYISRAYQSEKLNVSLEMDLDPLNMKAIDAVPLGLIYNEMINNVYKHAFKNKMSGVIKVNLKDRDDMIELNVIDDGDGLPENFSLEKSNSLGMTIIKELTDQLQGDLNIHSNSVTEFNVRFKKK